ncbi:1449_t:CDS:2, partial [Entrophospora sp. SA101]
IMYKKTKQHIFKNYTSRRITPKVIKLNNDTDNTEYDGDYEYEYLKTTTTYFTKQNQGQEKIYNDIIDKEFKKKIPSLTTPTSPSSSLLNDDDSEKLFKMELPPTDNTAYNIWFYRRFENANSKTIQMNHIQNDLNQILSDESSFFSVQILKVDDRDDDKLESKEKNYLEKVFSSSNNRSLLLELINNLRLLINYFLYVGSESHYPNNVTEKTPNLLKLLDFVLESFKKYNTNNNNDDDDDDKKESGEEVKKVFNYVKELMQVAWYNNNVRTRTDSDNRRKFRKA